MQQPLLLAFPEFFDAALVIFDFTYLGNEHGQVMELMCFYNTSNLVILTHNLGTYSALMEICEENSNNAIFTKLKYRSSVTKCNIDILIKSKQFFNTRTDFLFV